jgi:hypothetical protein
LAMGLDLARSHRHGVVCSIVTPQVRAGSIGCGSVVLFEERFRPGARVQFQTCSHSRRYRRPAPRPAPEARGRRLRRPDPTPARADVETSRAGPGARTEVDSRRRRGGRTGAAEMCGGCGGLAHSSVSRPSNPPSPHQTTPPPIHPPSGSTPTLPPPPLSPHPLPISITSTSTSEHVYIAVHTGARSLRPPTTSSSPP